MLLSSWFPASLLQTSLLPSTCIYWADTRWFDPWVRKSPWRRKWQPTAVFLLGKSHGQRSLVGYCPQGCKETATMEARHSLDAKACSRQCRSPNHCHSHSLRGRPAWWTMSPLCLDAFCSFTLSSLTIISRIEKCSYHFIQVPLLLHFPFSFWYWFFPPPILGPICFFLFPPLCLSSWVFLLWAWWKKLLNHPLRPLCLWEKNTGCQTLQMMPDIQSLLRYQQQIRA